MLPIPQIIVVVGTLTILQTVFVQSTLVSHEDCHFKFRIAILNIMIIRGQNEGSLAFQRMI